MAHPYCPGLVRKAYQSVKTILSSMIDTDAQRARVQENGGGVMGALKSSCSIF